VDKKYNTKKALTSEDFNTAGRSIKTGLTASNVVSQWTWAATLLQSSNVAWQVSGPFDSIKCIFTVYALLALLHVCV
jgi:urea-proton symporter